MYTTLLVRITNNYGSRVVYPVCETAQKFAALVGTKTLTADTIQKIRDLGYAIHVQQQEI
jgi:hypothetical protein